VAEESSHEASETPFTLRAFIEAGRERLALEVVAAGGALDREVPEAACSRPGLALTGFFGYFAWRRLQVIGKAEWAYLESLPSEEALARVKSLFDHGAYCLILAGGMAVAPGIAELALSAGAVVLRTTLLTREFFNRSAWVLDRLRAPQVKLYGTTVEVAGLGVMIEGAPGLGKSETALGLVKRGNPLIADDFTRVRKDVPSNTLFVSACDATRDFMEIRGIGIIHVPSVFGVSAVRAEKKLDLVITLRSLDETEGELDRSGQDRLTRTILGVEVPQIVIPVAAGRDLVNLVETAAQQYKLLAAGFDAVNVLDARLRARAVQHGEFHNKQQKGN